MKFIQLVSALKLIDAQLAHAIATDDKASRHALLLRDSTALLDRIETYVPQSASELREMLGFFSHRAIDPHDSAAGRHDFQIALSLARRFGDGPFTSRPDEAAHLPDASGSAAGAYALARQVSDTRERLAVIDQAYRFLAASPSHARFLKTSSIALLERHLCEAIGPERFERRARAKIDLCFRGAPQDYIYLFDDRIDGQRVIRCTISPVRDARNRIYGALINLRDVTSETGRRDAAPQKEPGTT